MGRNRTFDEADVIARCAGAFRTTGYEGTSIDDLVQATGLHRGSLYKAFGSKRGLFVEALRQASSSADPADRHATPDRHGAQDRHGAPDRRNTTDGQDTTDLLLVALMELAPRDPEVRTLAFDILHDPRRGLSAQALGERLTERALQGPAPRSTSLTPSTPSTPSIPSIPSTKERS